MSLEEPGERTGSLAFRCLMCAGTPAWRLTREGDVVTTWACAGHLHFVADDLLEPGRTALILTRFVDHQDFTAQ